MTDDSRTSGIHALEDELASLARPPVKALRDERTAYRESATCRFRAMVDAACANGWTLRKLARASHCTVRHICDCYDGKRNVPGWLLEALPREAQIEGTRVTLAKLRSAVG